MKKENIKLSITILLIVVFSLSVTYAWLELSANSSTNENQSGCFVVNYSGQEINNQSLKSTTNYLEGASSNIILSKNSNCKIYNEASIYIHTNTEGTTAPLSNGAMQYKLVKVEGEGQTATETEISTGSITAEGDTLLNDTNNGQDQTKKIILTDTNTTYKVYLWIDPEISKGTYNGKTYSGYLYASSTQSSTVKE